MTTLPNPDELRERLAALAAERGFLLPHHGALAAAAPDLHAAYHAMYTALTLTDRHLSPFEREFIWLCILIATREPVGTHHVDLFQRAGGTEDQLRAALRLTGYAGASGTFGFIEEHWQDHFPGIAAQADYLAGIDGLNGGAVPQALTHLAMAAVQMSLRNPRGIKAHVAAVYAAPDAGSDLREERLVEALSLAIWPVGVNRFVDATRIWHDMIRAGEVTPSPRFQAWACVPGQGALLLQGARHETGRSAPTVG